VNLRVVAERSVSTNGPGQRPPGAGEGAARAKQRTIVARDGKTVRANVWRLGELPAGRQLDGPAILAGPDTTAFIEPGWGGVVHDSGAVILERA